MINVLVLSLLFWKLGPSRVVFLCQLTHSCFQKICFHFSVLLHLESSFFILMLYQTEKGSRTSADQSSNLINGEISDPLDSCCWLNENTEMNVSVLANTQSERWKILSRHTESDTWDTWAHIISTFIYRWLLCNLCECSSDGRDLSLDQERSVMFNRILRKLHLKTGKL